jgi:hypothetical protein
MDTVDIQVEAKAFLCDVIQRLVVRAGTDESG